jgi:hypothetical protein
VNTDRPHQHHRTGPVLVVLGILLLAACSAHPPATTLPQASGAVGAAPSASASLDPEDALLEYARCMRQNGVDVPDPVDGALKVDGRGVAREQMQAAEDACAKWQEMADSGGTGQPLSEDEKQAFLDQASCLRDRGWNVSDPVFDSDGGVKQQFHAGADQPGDPKPGDPQFEKDMKECAAETGVDLPGDTDTTDGD